MIPALVLRLYLWCQLDPIQNSVPMSKAAANQSPQADVPDGLRPELKR